MIKKEYELKLKQDGEERILTINNSYKTANAIESAFGTGIFKVISDNMSAENLSITGVSKLIHVALAACGDNRHSIDVIGGMVMETGVVDVVGQLDECIMSMVAPQSGGVQGEGKPKGK